MSDILELCSEIPITHQLPKQQHRAGALIGLIVQACESRIQCARVRKGCRLSPLFESILNVAFEVLVEEAQTLAMHQVTATPDGPDPPAAATRFCQMQCHVRDGVLLYNQ